MQKLVMPITNSSHSYSVCDKVTLTITNSSYYISGMNFVLFSGEIVLVYCGVKYFTSNMNFAKSTF